MSGNKERIVQIQEEEKHVFHVPEERQVDWEAIRRLHEDVERRPRPSIEIKWSYVGKAFFHGIVAIFSMTMFVNLLPPSLMFSPVYPNPEFIAACFLSLALWMSVETTGYINKAVKRPRRRPFEGRYHQFRRNPRRRRRRRR